MLATLQMHKAKVTAISNSALILTMEESISKWERFSFGLLLPMLSLVVGLILVMAMETNAGAAEFASLGIMLISITVLPMVLIINGIVAFQPSASRSHCYRRGMWLPGLMILVAILYQLGVIDALF